MDYRQLTSQIRSLRKRIKDAKENYEFFYYGVKEMSLSGDILMDWNQKAQEYHAEYVGLMDQMRVLQKQRELFTV